MITADEFINKTIGCPWVNRAEDNGAYDCWGVVVASFREIEGVELPQLTGYADKHCKTSEAAKEAEKTGKFMPSQARNGAIMTVSDNNGNITHVGRCLCGRVLHATKSLGVRWTTYQAINTQFKNVRFYRYAPN